MDSPDDNYAQFFNVAQFSDWIICFDEQDGNNSSSSVGSKRKSFSESQIIRRSSRLAKKTKLDEPLADVSLIPEGSLDEGGKKLHVASIVLASQSDFFKRLFVSPFAEQSKREVVLRLNTGETPTAVEVIKCVYNKALPKDKTPMHLLGMLVIADRYGLVYVCKAIVDELVKNEELAVDECLLSLSLPEPILTAHFYQPLKSYAKERLAVIFRFFSHVYVKCDRKFRVSESFLKLSTAALGIILDNEKTSIHSENDVWPALCLWEQHSKDRCMDDLLPHLRFAQMDPDYLFYVVERSTQYKTSRKIKVALADAYKFQALLSKPYALSYMPHLGDVTYRPRESYSKTVSKNFTLCEFALRELMTEAKPDNSFVNSSTQCIFGYEMYLKVKKKDGLRIYLHTRGGDKKLILSYVLRVQCRNVDGVGPHLFRILWRSGKRLFVGAKGYGDKLRHEIVFQYSVFTVQVEVTMAD